MDPRPAALYAIPHPLTHTRTCARTALQGNRQPSSVTFKHGANVARHGHTPIMMHWDDVRDVLHSALPPGAHTHAPVRVGRMRGRVDGARARAHDREAHARIHCISRGM